MKEEKTKTQLINEIKQLRGRIAELEALETDRTRTEELLQQERETFFTILQNAPYGVVLVDRDGKHLYRNPAFTEITGYTLEDIPTGKDWTHKAYPDKAYRKKVTEFWAKDRKLGGTRRVLNVVCKDGKTREIEFSTTVLHDGRVVAMLMDITERKEMEDKLQRAYSELKDSEQRYRTLVENISHTINLIDADHTILAANAAQSKELNKPVSELIGKKCFREFAKRDAVCPKCPGVQAMATGKPTEIEVGGERDDGGHYHARVQTFPVFGENGTANKFIQVTEDITERKEMEENLRESEERFRLLVDHSKDAFFLHEFGKIIDCNQHACDSLGYTREELLRLSIEDIDVDVIPGKHKEKWKQMVPGVPITLEGVQRRKDGTTFPIEVRLVSFESGERTLMLGLSRDVTDRKRAEEALQRAYDELKASKEREFERTAQLEASNRELEAFSYSVSHDLRAPLRGIDGFSQALLEDYADQLDTQGKDYLQRVRAASQRLEHIIDDMLILSRVTRREMRRELVDLSAMAQEIATEFQANHPERAVSFVIAPGLIVKADPNLMRLALENLLDNAWKFTSKHATARIEVGVTANEGEHAYYVRDDGAGFNMAYAGKLFGAFQRLHPRIDFGGTGIGLATVQRIIHRHGGRVWAEGSVEQGATFYFTLPR